VTGNRPATAPPGLRTAYARPVIRDCAFRGSNFRHRPVAYQPSAPEALREATHQYFAPLETFPERFAAMLAEVRAHRFDAFELWLPHLDPQWSMPDHVRSVQTIARMYGVRLTAINGWLGRTPAEFERVCRLAAALEVRLLVGATGVLAADRAGVVRLLDRYDLELAVENQRQIDPAALLREVGRDRPDRIGVGLHTGWFGTQGFNAANALDVLAPRLKNVCLADVRAPGGHDSVVLGYGCVPVRTCVRALRRMNYTGGLSVGFQPDDRDPGPGAAVSRGLVDVW
jgi:L-ribulose-5-phosphate 3-epimerase